jgi:hypothetical protein
MPDYSPIFVPGTAITLQASGPVDAGDPVAVSGSGTVDRAAAGALAYVGVAGHSANQGALVTVFCGKIVHEGPGEGPVTAGMALMVSGEDGRQVTEAGDPSDPNVIGLALTSAADGFDVRWLQYLWSIQREVKPGERPPRIKSGGIIRAGCRFLTGWGEREPADSPGPVVNFYLRLPPMPVGGDALEPGSSAARAAVGQVLRLGSGAQVRVSVV